jgi:deazaflavin-dependent oxidoreductase (nitroreductase family)
MPAPYWLARFNSRVMNRIVAPLAPRLPGFGLLTHTGRKTRRRYRTPVNIWPRGDRYVIALTYGPRCDWVRNVLASGSCMLQMRRGSILLTQPRLFRDERRRAVPAPLRPFLRLMRIYDFLELRDARAGGEAEPAKE